MRDEMFVFPSKTLSFSQGWGLTCDFSAFGVVFACLIGAINSPPMPLHDLVHSKMDCEAGTYLLWHMRPLRMHRASPSLSSPAWESCGFCAMFLVKPVCSREDFSLLQVVQTRITAFRFKGKELALRFGLTVFFPSWECPQFLLHPAVWDKVWNAVDILGRWVSLVFSRPRPACFVQWLKEPERGSEVSRKWHMIFQFFLLLFCVQWVFLHWCQKTLSHSLVSAWQFCFLDVF